MILFIYVPLLMLNLYIHSSMPTDIDKAYIKYIIYFIYIIYIILYIYILY